MTDQLTPATTAQHLVITVHGIRTFGEWQDRLAELIHKREPTASVIHYRYGYFSVLAFLIPFLRWLVTRRFRRALVETLGQGHWPRVDIVAHSFGTHLVAWALRGLAISCRPRIHTLIFAASVLKPGFRWGELLSGCVHRVVNECGTRDKVLLLNQLFVLFTGFAGRVGFSGMTGPRFRNRYFAFGHGGFFRGGGQPDESFMSEHWIPLLTSDHETPEVDQRNPPNVLEGVLIFLLNNSEPIKLTAYALPLLGVVGIIYGLYRQSSALSVYNAAIRERDPQLASLLAMEIPSGWEPPGIPALVNTLAHKPVPTRVLRGHRFPVQRSSFGLGDTLLLSASRDGTVKLWPVEHGSVGDKPATWQIQGGELTDAWVSGDGTSLVVTSTAGTVQIWSLKDGRPVDEPMTLAATGAWPGSDLRSIILALEDGKIQVRRLKSLEIIAEIELSREYGSSPVGAWFTEGLGLTVMTELYNRGGLWRTDADGIPLKPTYLNGHSGLVLFAEASNDGRFLVTADEHNNGAKLWHLDARRAVREVAELRGNTGPVSAASFSEDGERLVTASSTDIVLWRLTPDGQPQSIGSLRGHTGRVGHVAFSPSAETVLAVAGEAVVLWDLNRQQALAASTIYEHRGPVLHASFSADSRFVATASVDGTRIWPLGQAAVVGRPEVFDLPGSFARHASLSRTGDLVAVGAADGTTRVWHLEDGKTTGPPLELEPHSKSVCYTGFSPDDRLFVTGSEDGTARGWVVTDGEIASEHWVVDGHGKSVCHIAFANSGERMATTSYDGNVKLWSVSDAERPKEVASLRHDAAVMYAVFSSDDRLLITVSGGTARLWEVAEDPPIEGAVINGHDRGVRHASFDRDGKMIATGASDGTVRVWEVQDARSVRQMAVLRGHTGVVSRCQFSRDGRFLLTAANDGTVRTWSLSSGTSSLEPVILRQESFIWSASLSPAGTAVVTDSSRGTPFLWHLRDGRPVGPATVLRGHGREVTQSTFSADGRYVLTASVDGTARLWLVDWEELRDRLDDHIDDCLSAAQRVEILGENWRAANRQTNRCWRMMKRSDRL